MQLDLTFIAQVSLNYFSFLLSVSFALRRSSFKIFSFEYSFNFILILLTLLNFLPSFLVLLLLIQKYSTTLKS